MKKHSLLFLLLPLLAAAHNPVIKRADILPGAGTREISTGSREKLELTADYADSGTLSLWVCPQNWGDSDKAWHFFVRSGEVSKNKPHLLLYRFPNGTLRLLWSKNSEKKQVCDIIADGRFSAGIWTHLAFTWQQSRNRTILKLYINGKMVKSCAGDFTFDRDFPLRWEIGDIPQWNPRSIHGTALGRCELYKREISAEEIAGIAAQKFTDGKITCVNRQFTPGSTNIVRGISDVPAIYLHTVFAGESGNTVEQRIPVKNFSGGFEAEVKVPDFAIETRMTLLKNESASPAWRITRITYAPWLPPLLPDYWHASWIWLGKRSDPDSHRYLRREFDTDPAELTLAAFQWASDDRADVYLNGQHIGQVRSWAAPQVREKLLPLLRKGRNILAVDAYNYGGGAGFFGELTLLKKDGTAVKIGSDETWKISQQPFDNWNQLDFDSSNWQNAEILMRPPQVPYGMTPYRNFVPVPEVKQTSPALDITLDAGGKAMIRSEYTLPSAMPGSPVEFSVHFAGGEIFRIAANVKRENGKMVLSREILFPAAAIPGEYRISAVCRGMKFAAPEIGKVTVKTGHEEAELTAEVKKINGAPTLLLNNKAVPAMFFKNAINFRNETAGNRFISGFDRCGIRLAEISIGNVWKNDNTLDTGFLEQIVLSAFFYAPETRLVVFFNLDAPPWLVKKYPQERFMGDKGAIDELSYASEIYRKTAAEFVFKVVSYMKTRPYYHRIAGFGFGGGEDGQFMQWTGRNLDFIGDYSSPMQQCFHRFLRQKYKTVENLNQKWRKSYRDFAEIPLPAVKRRLGSDSQIFLDPAADADIVDFNRVFADSAADFLLECAAAAKKASGNKKITMAYYGKFFSVAGHLQWGELAIEKVLASPALDCLIAVEYNQRSSGNPHSISAVPESYALHNKIFIDEADIRTFLSGAKNWAYAGTGFETSSMIRKMFVFNHVRGHGIHWFDIHGGAFENSAIMAAISGVNKIAAGNLTERRKNAQIAFIVDEKSFLYTTVMIRKFTGRYLLHMQNGIWNRIGAPFDVYFAGDLAAGKVPDCKMYVFTSNFAVTPELTKAVEKLKNNRRMLVFLGNQGMIADWSSSMANISAFTGITVADGGRRELSLKLDCREMPESIRLSRNWHTSSGIISPVALPADKDARLFGTLPDGSKPLAIKQFADWTSVFSAVPVLPAELWRQLAKLAGVHIYTEDDDTMLYIGANMLGVHCRNGGVKKITFPEEMDFTDAVTGEICGRKSKVLTLKMTDKETRLIIFSKADQIKK